MITENTKLARLIGEVLRLSDDDVESDERWAAVTTLRELLDKELDLLLRRLPAGSGFADPEHLQQRIMRPALQPHGH
jgi:hypothetical protein